MINDNNHTWRCIITIQLYKLTGKNLGELKAGQKAPHHINKWLPEFCIRGTDGKIVYTCDWLQFIDDGNEEYYLLDIEHTEEPLREELSNSGYEWLTDDLEIDFRFLYDVKHISFNQMFTGLNGSVQIVFDVSYSGGDGIYGDDWSTDIELVGYLHPITKELKYITKDDRSNSK